MGSLAGCLKRLTISGDEDAHIRRVVKQYREDGIEGPAANIKAVQELIRDTEAERESVLTQLRETLTPENAAKVFGDVTTPAPATTKETPRGAALFSRRDAQAPPFYSQIERIIQQKMPNRANFEQMRGILSPNNGAKPDEMKWMGMDDFIQSKESFTKDEVLAFIKANQVQVKEVVLGRDVEKRNALIDARNRGEITTDELAAKVTEIEEANGPPKFSSYQLPGGRNYRELLLTLPESNVSTEADMQAFFNTIREKNPNVSHSQLMKAWTHKRAELRRANFQSSHFSEPNILAHVRFNDRTDADGKNVLFLEEIQSDWHQKGRTQGYGAALTPEEKREFDGMVTRDLIDVERDRFTTLQRRLRKDGVPDAPFKKTWHELALKRMLRYAAANGYDSMAWTTGAQQAERYDLSKHIDRLEAWKMTNGKYDIKAIGKDGEEVIANVDLDEGKLTDTVGKELAKKIVSGENAKLPSDYIERQRFIHSQSFSGLDLKVGGTGMKGFYDEILPAFMNKYGKKWGARVSDVTLPYMKDDSQGYQEPGTVHSLPITESMKQSVMEEGQPLFAKSRDQRAPTMAQFKRAWVAGASLGPGQKVIDSSEQYPAGMMADLATRPYVKTLTPAMDRVIRAMTARLQAADANFGNPAFVGLSPDDYYVGVNLRGPDGILLNPWGALWRTQKDIQEQGLDASRTPEYMAARLLKTMVHELTHQQVEKHGGIFDQQLESNYTALGPDRLETWQRSLIDALEGATDAIARDLRGQLPHWKGRTGLSDEDRGSDAESRPIFNSQDVAGEGRGARGRPRETVRESREDETPSVDDRAEFQRRDEPASVTVSPPTPSRHKYVRGLTAAQQAALQHVHGSPRTWRARLDDFKSSWKRELVQGLFDQYAPILDYSKKGYVLSRMAKGGDGTMEALMLYGKPYVDGDGAYRVEYSKADGMQGFSKVLSALQGEQDRFLEWVAAQRADRLKGIGLEHLYSAQDIAALKTLNRGKMPDGTSREASYIKALKELNDWNDAMLKIGVDSGLISAESRALFKDVPYVPFYRLQEDGAVQGFGMKPGLVNQYAWKKLKGGTEHLNDDLLANLLQNWSHIITASAKNRAARETLHAAVKAGVAEEVPSGMPGKELVHYLDEGKTVTFSVSDPALMDAVASLHYAGLGAVGKPFQAMKRVLSFAVTVNPAYKIRNLIRDSIQAIGTSELSYNPIKNIAQGVKATAITSETRAQLLAGGGMIRFGSMLDGNNADRTRRLVERGVDPALILDSAGKIEQLWKNMIVPAFEAYQEFGDRGEQVNRAALYEQLLKKGMSHQEATFWARDLMDFSMSGKWAAVRILTQVVPFMNARLQGLYKLGRAAQTDYRKLGVTLGTVALASIGLMLAYGDDEDWKKREDWDRENFWWFKIGDLAIRIPKPFEIGAMGTIAERSVEYLTNKEMTGKRFAERMSATVFNQLSMNPTPQLVKPLMDLYANKDSFTGRRIETMGMERLRKSERATERTSEIARFMGGLGLPDPAQLAMGRWDTLSPVQVDSLVRGYFSWLGSTTTTVLDYGIRPFVDRGERPNMTLRNVFLAGSFVETLPSGSSRYLSELYSQAAEIEQAYGSYRDALKRGDRDGARSIMEQEKDKISLYRSVEHVKRQESLINTKMKMIEGSRSLSGDEKRRRLDQLQSQKHLLAKRIADRQLAAR